MSRIFNQVSEHSTKATITAMANGDVVENNQRRFDVGVKFSSKEENYVEKPPLHWIGTNLSAFLGKSIFSQILFIQKLCCS